MSENIKPLLDTDLDEATLSARLARIWSTRPGLGGWLTAVDHKMIGRR